MKTETPCSHLFSVLLALSPSLSLSKKRCREIVYTCILLGWGSSSLLCLFASGECVYSICALFLSQACPERRQKILGSSCEEKRSLGYLRKPSDSFRAHTATRENFWITPIEIGARAQRRRSSASAACNNKQLPTRRSRPGLLDTSR